MAEAKLGRVLRIQPLGRSARLLEIEPEHELKFVGGQYIIVDSGLTLPNGKAAKRAYSILSSDHHATHFELAVKHIENGPGSGFMHGLEVGREVRFSGPWGRFSFEPDARGSTLVFATDTGITAALGLLQSGRAKLCLAQSLLIWLRPSADEFLPEGFVQARLPSELGEFELGTLPPVGHPDRVPHTRTVLEAALVKTGPSRAFVAGDGAVNYALLEDLNGAGIPTTRDHLESFFNMPKSGQRVSPGP